MIPGTQAATPHSSSISHQSSALLRSIADSVSRTDRSMADLVRKGNVSALLWLASGQEHKTTLNQKLHATWAMMVMARDGTQMRKYMQHKGAFFVLKVIFEGIPATGEMNAKYKLKALAASAMAYLLVDVQDVSEQVTVAMAASQFLSFQCPHPVQVSMFCPTVTVNELHAAGEVALVCLSLKP